MTEDELRAVYDCLRDYLRTAYDDSGQLLRFANWSPPRVQPVAYRAADVPGSAEFLDWKNFATAPYVSSTHGDRFVVNHVNEVGAQSYGKYEEIDQMPAGGIVAKPSFTVAADGQARLGPLFLMEKMPAGFDAETHDWRYSMVMPDGSLFGVTGGHNSDGVRFCAECHNAVAETQDALFFLPEELRVR